MALICKHGSRNDDMICGLCAVEAGNVIVDEWKDRIEQPKKYVCKWCSEEVDLLLEYNAKELKNYQLGSSWLTEIKHMHCQKAYEIGQQWAINAIRKQTWLMCHHAPNVADWLEEEIKK